MRTTYHGSYLIQLTRYPLLFPVNCYFVREDDGLTLIDTGLPGSAPAILRVAQALALPIRRIVLTHAHGDHVGSLDHLCHLLPNVDIFVSIREARFLAGEMSLLPDEPPTRLRGGYQPVATRPNYLVVHGDRIGSLKVIATPGHTPGHIALLDERDGTLIAGDALQTRAGVAVSGVVRPFFPFPAWATWNRPLALASAQQLRALKPVRLAVGHGDVCEQPLEAMDRAIVTASQPGRALFGMR